MKLCNSTLLTCLACLPIIGCSTTIKPNPQKTAQPIASITPKPLELQQKQGQFVLNSKTVINCLGHDSTLAEIADYLQDKLEFATGHRLNQTTASSIKSNTIHLTVDPALQTRDEGHILEITPKYVMITGKSPQALFHGIQSLLQLFPAEITRPAALNGEIFWNLPAVSVTDAPRFQYRGMHLDVARNFFDVDFIKKYIDYLAMYKMNTLHWHLTEDQGWRIEIKKYPKLTEIGAKRAASPLYGNRNQLDGKPHGPYFYTQEEVREIVKYAADRYITIIPEIELPGHAQAALASYPQLGCTGGPYEVWSRWGISPEVFCAGKETTFQFLTDVLDEVCSLFPSTYIHIGGDECPKDRWNNCPHCQQRMQDEHIKDAHHLQSYFIHRIEKHLNAKGRQIIGWDEILEGGLAPNATVMSWRGVNGGIAAANMGHDVVMTPTSHCYFDYYQGNPATEPEAIGGYLPLKKVYEFEPIPASLAKDKQHHIIGAQGNMWSEYMPTEAQCEYMLMPRMIALAEVVWSDKGQKNWVDFKVRLNDQLRRLDYMGVNYRKPSPPAPLKTFEGNGFTVKTNMSVYQNHLPTQVLDHNKTSFFWSSHPVNEDHQFIIVFDQPKSIHELTIVTGKENGNDRLQHGTLQLSTDGSAYGDAIDFKNGKAKAKTDHLVKSIKIQVTGEQAQWLIIRNLELNER